MSSKALAYHVIICDGCGDLFGAGKEYDTSATARQAALAAGWKLVPKLDTRGRPVRVPEHLGRVGKAAKDACPQCAPTLEPGQWGDGGRPSGDAWFVQRIKALEAENERLRRGAA